jgi:hypothetical protein
LSNLQQTAYKDVKKLLAKNPVKTNLTDEQVDSIIQETLVNTWNDSWSRNESKIFYKNLVKNLKMR